jgi:Glycosyl transferase family 21
LRHDPGLARRVRRPRGAPSRTPSPAGIVAASRDDRAIDQAAPACGLRRPFLETVDFLLFAMNGVRRRSSSRPRPRPGRGDPIDSQGVRRQGARAASLKIVGEAGAVRLVFGGARSGSWICCAGRDGGIAGSTGEPGLATVQHFEAAMRRRAPVLRKPTLVLRAGLSGFSEAIADQLADHYRLGELTRRLGLRTVLSRHSVTTDVLQFDPKSLFARKVRWLRTIRSIQPLGFAFCFAGK